MTRRGLTLVEVLAATVLLVIITTTCVPLFRDAIRTARAGAADAPFGLSDLADVADRLLIDPSTFDLPPLEEVDRIEVPWPDAPDDRPPLVVRRLSGSTPPAADGDAADDDDEPHAWLQVRCGPWSVHRWMRVTDDAAPTPTDGDADDDAGTVSTRDAIPAERAGEDGP